MNWKQAFNLIKEWLASQNKIDEFERMNVQFNNWCRFNRSDTEPVREIYLFNINFKMFKDGKCVSGYTNMLFAVLTVGDESTVHYGGDIHGIIDMPGFNPGS